MENIFLKTTAILIFTQQNMFVTWIKSLLKLDPTKFQL